MQIATYLDLDRYPLHQPDNRRTLEVAASCRVALEQTGMFTLTGLMRSSAVLAAVGQIKPLMAAKSFTHHRSHNIYFESHMEGVTEDHLALAQRETVNHTLCADQMPDTIICQIYEWQPLADFLAAVLGKSCLYAMSDPLARANVMSYHHGEALNWHFARSEFTVTLLIQALDAGGEFQYRSGLRTDSDPNLDGVARLLRGEDSEVKTLQLTPGTLNVFRGKNTAHRVSTTVGERERMVAVFSYFERPGVNFSVEERLGFYGRTS